MPIQWFPGHMAKAKRQIKENLKHVDIVLELIDARAPKASSNPTFQELIGHKPTLKLFMKKDLADDDQTKKWLQKEKKKHHCLAINVNVQKDIERLIETIKAIGQEINAQREDKGISRKRLRVLILGIPNVGKSTLINRLARRRAAKVGNRPGVTKGQQWIKVNQAFELLDTPGILWPKFATEQIGLTLAALGTIKDHLLPLQDVAAFVITFLQKHYPKALNNRFALPKDLTDMWEIFEHIGRRRGAIQSGGKVNFDAVAEILLHDLRTGKLGKITLEQFDKPPMKSEQ